jgi:hypothetical protein
MVLLPGYEHVGQEYGEVQYSELLESRLTFQFRYESKRLLREASTGIECRVV